MFRITTLAAIGLALSPAALAQTGPETMSDAQIDAELMAMDSAMFGAAFETCDLDRVRSLVTEDVEFYHDKSGLMLTDADAFVDQINCLNWTQGDAPQIRRVLEPGSLTSHRIGDFGAMQMGRHSFHLVREDGSDQLLETGDFIHLWRYSPEGWQIARIISYDHRDAE